MSTINVGYIEGPSTASNKIYIKSGSVLDITNSPGGAAAIDLSVDAGDISAGTLANARLADGHILQVVQTVFTGMFDSTASTWTAVTGMSASITPSSTDSKILVMIQSASSNSTSTANVSSVIYRGGAISAYLGDTAGDRIRAGAAVANPGAWAQGPFSLIYLDSPSTTSATTYQLYSKSPSATWRINGTGEDYDATNQWRSASSVTLMEVKA